ncbi:hypothetical protein LAZ67_17001539 [Cordylochernes scorpioides]|uniref:Uncharacterized protein n=1 Tax=Cordylochernes scorpioides TaxID=51811 RepID=A0ABY6LDE7_9ARAC|nr:hypothetical protein LAZ67_17001539 [Cordylochernes scorpioides]
MTIKKCFKSACCLLSLLCHCLHRQSTTTAAAAALLVSLSCPPTSGKAERYCQEKGVSTRAVELRRANRGASKEELLRGGGSSRAQRLCLSSKKRSGRSNWLETLGEITTDEPSAPNSLTSQSDKGTNTVVLDRSAYHSKILDILQDRSTFIHISAQDSTKAYDEFKKSLSRLKRSGYLSLEEYKSFLTNHASNAYIYSYGLPKIHKPSVPLRPIIAYRLSPAFPLAKFLSSYLPPF